MAFEHTSLVPLVQAHPFSLFGYHSTTDTLAQIGASGYFNQVRTMLPVGTWILINGTDNGGIGRVNANNGTTVDITNPLPLNTSDTA